MLHGGYYAAKRLVVLYYMYIRNTKCIITDFEHCSYLADRVICGPCGIPHSMVESFPKQKKRGCTRLVCNKYVLGLQSSGVSYCLFKHCLFSSTYLQRQQTDQHV